MSNFYVIRWRLIVNGRTGKGTRRFPEEEARRLAAELNREYPDIEHEVVDAPAEPAAAPSSPLASSAMALAASVGPEAALANG